MLVRLIFSSVLVIAFLSYVTFKVWNGEPLSAIALLLTGLLFVWATLMGLSSLFDASDISLAIISLITIFSIGNVFMVSDTVNTEKGTQNFNLMLQAMAVQYCPRNLQPSDAKRASFRALRKIFIKQCALQNHQNMSKLTADVVKARYLDPVSGLADSIHSDFLKGKPVTCLSLAEKMNEICPGKFKF